LEIGKEDLNKNVLTLTSANHVFLCIYNLTLGTIEDLDNLYKKL